MCTSKATFRRILIKANFYHILNPLSVTKKRRRFILDVDWNNYEADPQILLRRDLFSSLLQMIRGNREAFADSLKPNLFYFFHFLVDKVEKLYSESLSVKRNSLKIIMKILLNLFFKSRVRQYNQTFCKFTFICEFLFNSQVVYLHGRLADCRHMAEIFSKTFGLELKRQFASYPYECALYPGKAPTSLTDRVHPKSDFPVEDPPTVLHFGERARNGQLHQQLRGSG